MRTEEINKIYELLVKGWGSEVSEMMKYLKEILTYYARLTELQNQANEALIRKRGAFRAEHDTKELKQYQYKDVLDCFCIDEIKHLEFIEGLLKTISKQSEALRTIISAEKNLINLGVSA